ncbi:MAG: sugar-transfer associated ATP-grasp domain-containing protein [Bacteroidales bacterium]
MNLLNRYAKLAIQRKDWVAAIKRWEQIVEVSEKSGGKFPNNECVDFQHIKQYFEAGLLKNVDAEYVEEVQEYWRNNYGKEVSPVSHLAFFNITGKKDPRIVPKEQMWNEITPFFNDKKMWYGYCDKNIYDMLINAPRSVETVLKRVRGNYYDGTNNSISSSKVYNILLSFKADLIVKPSKTDSGKDVRKISFNENSLDIDDKIITLTDLEEMYGKNFIIQKVIQQHPVMSAPHPQSVNTLRMVSLRWDNEIRHLMTFARFGIGGKVKDNASAGGLCCGVTDSGVLMNFAIDENFRTYTYHPTSKYNFANQAVIPNYSFFKEFIVDLHKDVLHFDFVSWDVAVGSDGMPIFLEANFRGATWLYQFATQKPLFGDFTEEVLQYIKSSKKRNKHKSTN